ncbi:MAG: hypothetical protein IPL73_24270 [Candidatus Obscuribacter sp.]|nr:hypothetical protein [Candidatus Obscuribacter sp.]
MKNKLPKSERRETLARWWVLTDTIAGAEHLTNAQYTTPKATADVYNLPGKIGKQSIKQEFKLDLDSAHSMHLETGGKEILYPKAGR